jgi:signal transduction histidine kinase
MDLGKQRRWRRWNRRLWFLSGALGFAAMLAMVAFVHDTRQVRQAARVAVLTTAEQIAARAGHRLDVITLQTFGPVLAMSSPGAHTRGSTLRGLVREQEAGQRCRCREMLPAEAFFRYESGAAGIELTPANPDAPSPADTLMVQLTELARRDIGRDAGIARPGVRLTVNRGLAGRAVLTATSYDPTGRAVALYGLVADAKATAAALFAPETSPSAAMDSAGTLATLDSASLQVETTDAVHLFGFADTSRRLRARYTPTGSLNGLTILVTLGTYQLRYPLLPVVPQTQLWLLGLLLLGTSVVIAIAFNSTRREIRVAQTRSDFIAGVSHDLRMPLAQILLASETLAMQRERDDDERVSLASSIVREAQRLAALVDNVLLFSRSGKVELRPKLEPVDVSTLFEEVVDAVQLAMTDAGQTLYTNAGDTSVVIANRQLLRQALVNLVDNSLKYGTAGQRIRLAAVAPSSERVRIVVEDEGPGVPASERARVFEPYERLARDQASERTGAGLGLAVVEQIVRACDGRVWLEETTRGGTRAIIELQSAEPSDATREVASTP